MIRVLLECLENLKTKQIIGHVYMVYQTQFDKMKTIQNRICYQNGLHIRKYLDLLNSRGWGSRFVG